MIKVFPRIHTGGVAGHSWDGCVSHPLKAFLFPPETKEAELQVNGKNRQRQLPTLGCNVSLQAVGPVQADDSAVGGGRQVYPGAAHRHQVAL